MRFEEGDLEKGVHGRKSKWDNESGFKCVCQTDRNGSRSSSRLEQKRCYSCIGLRLKKRGEGGGEDGGTRLGRGGTWT